MIVALLAVVATCALALAAALVPIHLDRWATENGGIGYGPRND